MNSLINHSNTSYYSHFTDGEALVVRLTDLPEAMKGGEVEKDQRKRCIINSKK